MGKGCRAAFALENGRKSDVAALSKSVAAQCGYAEWDSAGRVLIPANLRKRVVFEKTLPWSVAPTVWNCGGRDQWEAEMTRLWMMILKSWHSN